MNGSITWVKKAGASSAPRWNGASDGAQIVAMPTVPCATLTTGKPSAGAGRSGTATRLDTATSCPSNVVECASTRQTLAPPGPATASERMMAPGFPTGRGAGGV